MTKKLSLMLLISILLTSFGLFRNTSSLLVGSAYASAGMSDFSASASSYYTQNKTPTDPSCAIDGNEYSSWDSYGEYKGAWFQLTSKYGSVSLNGFRIVNGKCKSTAYGDTYYAKNARIKRFSLYVDGIFAFSGELKDTNQWQTVRLGKTVQGTQFRLYIDDVYEGSGTPKANFGVCITEIEIMKSSDAAMASTSKPSSKTTPAETAKPRSSSVSGSSAAQQSNKVQDFYDFSRSLFSISSASRSPDGDWYRSFNGNKGEVEQAVNAYVSTLTNGSWNFRVNHVHSYEYKGQKFWSVTLNYTGFANVEKNRLKQQYEDSYYGDIMIYYLTDYSKYKGYIYVAKGFEVTDLGLRADGNHVSVEIPGLSSNASLIENSDGSFSTSDGRLKAYAGQASILRDGNAYSTKEVSLNRNRETGREELLIENYYRNEGIVLGFPYSSLMTGDVYDLKQMGQTTFKDGYEKDLKGYFGKRFNYIFGICHNGNYLYPHPDPTESIQKLFIHVLLWDTNRGLAVFYIACEVNQAPYTVEALAVFNMNAAMSYNGSAERVNMKVGDERTFTFSDRAFSPSYELYQWEVLEGSANVELSGNRYQQCRVTATWQGQARIRVTYLYGGTEPDVLTGIDRHVEKSVTKEYLIDISK